MNWLQLIRWKNLLLLSLTFVLFKYILFDPDTGLNMAMNDMNFALFVIAVLCVAAGGYIINDIQDIETDAINKSHRPLVKKSISLEKAHQAYIAFTVAGVGIGFYLANSIGKSGYAAYFIIIAAVLYIYSTALKQIALIGNLVVAFMIAFAILLLGIFDLIPVMDANNSGIQMTFTQLLLDYAVFAFLINLAREVIKDLEDIDGDYNSGMRTLPIVIGRERAGKIAFILVVLPLAAVIYYTLTYLYKQQVAVGYFLLFLVAPLLYAAVKSFSAETKAQWSHIASILKVIMVLGVLSTLVFKYIRM